jgi:hypothetical protein
LGEGWASHSIKPSSWYHSPRWKISLYKFYHSLTEDGPTLDLSNPDQQAFLAQFAVLLSEKNVVDLFGLCRYPGDVFQRADRGHTRPLQHQLGTWGCMATQSIYAPTGDMNWQGHSTPRTWRIVCRMRLGFSSRHLLVSSASVRVPSLVEVTRVAMVDTAMWHKKQSVVTLACVIVWMEHSTLKSSQVSTQKHVVLRVNWNLNCTPAMEWFHSLRFRQRGVNVFYHRAAHITERRTFPHNTYISILHHIPP